MAKTAPTFAGEWREYQQRVVPLGASAEQIEHAQLAFYAGAYVALGLVSAVCVDAETEAAGAAAVETLHQELRAFNERVLASAADVPLEATFGELAIGERFRWREAPRSIDPLVKESETGYRWGRGHGRAEPHRAVTREAGGQ